MPNCPLAASATNLPDYRYQPVTPPCESLRQTYGEGPHTDLTYEVIDHLSQLVESLKRGEIGFEYYTALSQHELKRVW